MSGKNYETFSKRIMQKLSRNIWKHNNHGCAVSCRQPARREDSLATDSLYEFLGSI